MALYKSKQMAKMKAALKSKNVHIRRMAQAAVNANPDNYC